jgi:putative endopeptidase
MTTSAHISSGILTEHFDDAVRPQDDLYRHVNGGWIRSAVIPEDRSRTGAVTTLVEEAQAAVRTIIEGADADGASRDLRKIGDLYASFMDEATLESLGVEPIRALLTEVDGIADAQEVLMMAGRFHRMGVSSLVDLYVENDPGAPDSYVPFLEQAGLGLPDESYYREERFTNIRDEYRLFIAEMFSLAGIGDGTSRAARIVALEEALAAGQWDNVATRDSNETYNHMAWSSVLALAPGVDLQRWRDGVAGASGAMDAVVVREPDFITGMAALLIERPLDDWKDWLRWQVVRSTAPYLTNALSVAHFSFYGTVITGAPQQPDRWKRAVALVEQAMGEAIGRDYVREHFDETSKAMVDELVANLLLAYRRSILGLEWMTDQTRDEALRKLSSIRTKIGYPASWRDYSALRFDRTDLLGNVRAAAGFALDSDLGKIGRPVDPDDWFATPQTVNAYYNPPTNEIVFPAAILQLPLFDQQRDAAANYGAIGAVIGHEIGHGFDDQGSQYDGEGRLRNWWTEADRAAFEERTQALTAQFDVLVPTAVPDGHVNGSLTIGENIGDLGGLAIAWQAYLISLGGEEPPVIEGMTGGQRFFLSYAQAWRESMRPEEAAMRLARDPHSPNEFRCNQIVRNIDEFYRAFDVTEGDALWLEPAERVAIW